MKNENTHTITLPLQQREIQQDMHHSTEHTLLHICTFVVPRLIHGQNITIIYSSYMKLNHQHVPWSWWAAILPHLTGLASTLLVPIWTIWIQLKKLNGRAVWPAGVQSSSIRRRPARWKTIGGDFSAVLKKFSARTMMEVARSCGAGRASRQVRRWMADQLAALRGTRWRPWRPSPSPPRRPPPLRCCYQVLLSCHLNAAYDGAI